MRSRIISGSVTNACQIFLILSLRFSSSYAAAPPMPSSFNSTLSIEEECKSEFSKVGLCLDYATGKAKTPPKDCCATIDDIRQENEVCLCYVIQQVHQGGSSLKELGVQESKLLELPKACKLDVKLGDCPKLLHLNSTSPDNAIFTNSSTASSAGLAILDIQWQSGFLQIKLRYFRHHPDQLYVIFFSLTRRRSHI
ncbi:hypothetical protein MKX01_038895 [Papaver californicum]|nr:hypothetical protein MKX01_038895 [Papaver californicum]